MSIKRYVLVSDFELVTTIVVGAEPRIIAFRNGSRHAGTRGFFITGIEAEQEAIEKSGGFGFRYKLDSEIRQSPSVKANQAVVEKSKDCNDSETNGSSIDDVCGQSEAVGGLTHETSVTSKNKAIAFMQEKFGRTFTQTADIAAMKEEAREVYNLVFDNWK